MVNFRIQELAEEKGLTREELSQICGISVDRIETLSQVRNLSVGTTSAFVHAPNASVETTAADTIAPFKITEETAAELRKIAAKLNVPVIELIKPVAKTAAFKLNILKIAEQKGITIEELSNRSGVHPALFAFYSSQAISKHKLAESPFQEHINKISETLGCSPEDLKIASELPPTRLRIEELAKERNLSLEDLSLITELPPEFINLVTTQPLDVFKLSNVFRASASFITPREAWCAICGCCFLDISNIETELRSHRVK